VRNHGDVGPHCLNSLGQAIRYSDFP
jgi:hypothetical protein